MAKVYVIAIAAVMAVFVFMGAEIYSANAIINTLTTEVNELHADKAEKQAEVDTLAADLELAGYTLSRMLAERESIAAIRAKADAEANRLRSELINAQQMVAKLRASQNVYVKEWANTPVPYDAVRLLKYADQSGNQNPDSNQSGAPNSTGRILAQLSADYSF